MLESISFPVGLFTEVAGNGDSFQVIQFYVALYFCVFRPPFHTLCTCQLSVPPFPLSLLSAPVPTVLALPDFNFFASRISPYHQQT